MKNKTTVAPNRKELNAAGVLPKIQAILRDENFNSFDDGSTSDVISRSLSKIDLMVSGIIFVMENGNVTDDDIGALFDEYYRLRDAIGIREESHSKIWSLAIRGEDPE